MNCVIFVFCLYHTIHCEVKYKKEVEGSEEGVVPVYEYLNFCGEFSSPNQRFVITKAKLEWGKWTKGQNQHDIEVDSPQGKEFGPGAGNLQICSAGRELSMSGTQGYIEIYPIGSNNYLNFMWDVSFFPNRFEYGFTADRSKYAIKDQTKGNNVKDRFFEIRVIS